MTLGEKIYELRTKQGLSQGDLAEQLNVSRQSISKWETNNSTPDLDKLIKMSQLFQVTLDELVLDKKPEAEKTADNTDSFSESIQYKTESPFSQVSNQSRDPRFPTRKIAGTILLCMGFMTFLFLTAISAPFDPITGTVLAMPFYCVEQPALFFANIPVFGVYGCSFALSTSILGREQSYPGRPQSVLSAGESIRTLQTHTSPPW